MHILAIKCVLFLLYSGLHCLKPYPRASDHQFAPSFLHSQPSTNETRSGHVNNGCEGSLLYIVKEPFFSFAVSCSYTPSTVDGLHCVTRVRGEGGIKRDVHTICCTCLVCVCCLFLVSLICKSCCYQLCKSRLS